MRRRGIHDVFHAALLRIHKPNDDRLFPGRSDEQIIGEATEEWAADRITAHFGASDQAIFEVLWKAGDKTWLSYAQVKDLNLINPYLELVGAETIADLPEGTGNPPQDDPQTYLGQISFVG
ncbi:hypothetical protein C0993_003566, partial [Termitomyces sp. T159_Od127]